VDPRLGERAQRVHAAAGQPAARPGRARPPADLDPARGAGRGLPGARPGTGHHPAAEPRRVQPQHRRSVRRRVSPGRRLPARRHRLRLRQHRRGAGAVAAAGREVLQRRRAGGRPGGGHPARAAPAGDRAGRSEAGRGARGPPDRQRGPLPAGSRRPARGRAEAVGEQLPPVQGPGAGAGAAGRPGAAAIDLRRGQPAVPPPLPDPARPRGAPGAFHPGPARRRPRRRAVDHHRHRRAVGHRAGGRPPPPHPRPPPGACSSRARRRAPRPPDRPTRAPS
jgi:hypothetical protein